MSLPSKTQISEAILYPKLIKDSFFIGCSVLRDPSGKIFKWSGGYSIVFQFLKGTEKWAFKVWDGEIPDLKERYKKISAHLQPLSIQYFVDFNYVENGLVVDGKFVDIHRMKWVEGQTLNEFLNNNIYYSNRILNLAEKFKEMVAFFHSKKIAHGDLQHGNLIITADGNIKVIDYDSMYIEALNGMNDTIKGLPGYQHPARETNLYINPKLDYFSELIIYLSLKVYAKEPSLWSDNDHLIFSRVDFDNPMASPIFNKLVSYNDHVISELAKRIRSSLQYNDISQLKSLEDTLLDIKLDEVVNPIINRF